MKTSDITSPQPANVWVLVDENPDSINDAAFAVDMNDKYPNTVWQDTPANYHCGACGFAFADGHSEIHKWVDPRTIVRNGSVGRLVVQNPLSADMVWLATRTSAIRATGYARYPVSQRDRDALFIRYREPGQR